MGLGSAYETPSDFSNANVSVLTGLYRDPTAFADRFVSGQAGLCVQVLSSWKRFVDKTAAVPEIYKTAFISETQLPDSFILGKSKALGTCAAKPEFWDKVLSSDYVSNHLGPFLQGRPCLITSYLSANPFVQGPGRGQLGQGQGQVSGGALSGDFTVWLDKACEATCRTRDGLASLPIYRDEGLPMALFVPNQERSLGFFIQSAARRLSPQLDKVSKVLFGGVNTLPERVLAAASLVSSSVSFQTNLDKDRHGSVFSNMVSEMVVSHPILDLKTLNINFEKVQKGFHRDEVFLTWLLREGSASSFYPALAKEPELFGSGKEISDSFKTEFLKELRLPVNEFGFYRVWRAVEFIKGSQNESLGYSPILTQTLKEFDLNRSAYFSTARQASVWKQQGDQIMASALKEVAAPVFASLVSQARLIACEVEGIDSHLLHKSVRAQYVTRIASACYVGSARKLAEEDMVLSPTDARVRFVRHVTMFDVASSVSLMVEHLERTTSLSFDQALFRIPAEKEAELPASILKPTEKSL